MLDFEKRRGHSVAPDDWNGSVDPLARADVLSVPEMFPSGEYPLSVCLWRENLYGLVSWWDVHQLAGEKIHAGISILERTRCHWSYAQPEGDAFAARLLGQKRILTDVEKSGLQRGLEPIEKEFRGCGLPTAAEAISELRKELTLTNFQVSGEHVVWRIDDVLRTTMREMKTVVFLCVPSDSAERFRSPLNDWDKVVARWGALELDISESSKCFALDRFAASIFHILLVAEFGVIQICDLLGVSGDKPGWGCVKRLQQILQKPFPSRSAMEQQYSKVLEDIVPLIIAVKDSSRHKITHIDNRLQWLDVDFSPQIASEVILSTRGFMRRLAEELPTVP